MAAPRPRECPVTIAVASFALTLVMAARFRSTVTVLANRNAVSLQAQDYKRSRIRLQTARPRRIPWSTSRWRQASRARGERPLIASRQVIGGSMRTSGVLVGVVLAM